MVHGGHRTQYPAGKQHVVSATGLGSHTTSAPLVLFFRPHNNSHSLSPQGRQCHPAGRRQYTLQLVDSATQGQLCTHHSTTGVLLWVSFEELHPSQSYGKIKSDSGTKLGGLSPESKVIPRTLHFPRTCQRHRAAKQTFTPSTMYSLPGPRDYTDCRNLPGPRSSSPTRGPVRPGPSR